MEDPQGETVAQLMSLGKTILTKDDVMDGLWICLVGSGDISDGTKLVTVHEPVI